MQYPLGLVKVVSHGNENDDISIEDIFQSFESFKLDPFEFACLKAIVLFRFGKKPCIAV